MRLIYEFPNIPMLAGVSVSVSNNNHDIECEVSGPNAEQVAPPIRAYFKSFNEIKPLIVHEGKNWYSLYWPPVPSEAHARFVEAFWRTWFFGNPTPTVLTLAITEKCQCRCFHCSADVGSSQTPPQLTVKEIAKIVHESIELGVANVVFTGGEPLLHESILECIALVPPEKAICQVFSNGIALDAKKARALKSAGVTSVKVSLDSPDPEEHDRLRGRKGTFRSVERAVKNALDAGLLVGLSTYASNDFVKRKYLGRIAALAHTWGVHEVTVFDAIATGRLLRSKDVSLTQRNRKVLLLQGQKMNKEYQTGPRIITQSWTNSDHKYAKYIGCLAASSHFHVTATGEFTPCDFTPLTFGNTLTMPVQTLWQRLLNHPAYREHCQVCRMQTSEFREQYLNAIPQGGPFPYPIELLQVKESATRE
jgi:MoaA/NifB/PqqE/SkfB family radical SAM enzyme